MKATIVQHHRHESKAAMCGCQPLPMIDHTAHHTLNAGMPITGNRLGTIDEHMAHTPPRIAVIHDWLTANGGAERVLECMLHCVPDADLFTLIDSGECLPPLIRARHRIVTSRLQKLPFALRHYRRLAPLMPGAIEALDLRAYDLVLSSSWAFAHGVITPAHCRHLAYVHSPMRWAWDMEDEYLDQAGLRGLLGRLARWQLARLRRWDVQAAGRPDVLVANSAFVAQRIRDCWHRPAAVIYPPVTIAPQLPQVAAHGAYVSVSRLVPYKRVDLWVKAFAFLPDRQLIVAGDGPERERLQAMAGPNVRFVGRITDREITELMAGARGFLQASKEDFGIAVLEAQGCGTPVLAYGVGGAQETVRGLDQPQPTGMLFDTLDPEAAAQAVRAFERHRFMRQDCRMNAERFSPARFQSELVTAVNRLGFELAPPA